MRIVIHPDPAVNTIHVSSLLDALEGSISHGLLEEIRTDLEAFDIDLVLNVIRAKMEGASDEDRGQLACVAVVLETLKEIDEPVVGTVMSMGDTAVIVADEGDQP